MTNVLETIECKYKSKLGKLYSEKQSNAWLDDIVFDVETSFEFLIMCNEKLPINSTKVEKYLTDDQVTYITEKLKYRGCVVEYVIEKSLNGKRYFVLTDLL